MNLSIRQDLGYLIILCSESNLDDTELLTLQLLEKEKNWNIQGFVTLRDA